MKKEDVLRKVRALIERADHPNTPEAEAAACRDRADSLMIAYAIENFELGSANQNERAKPEVREYHYGSTGDSAADNELAYLYSALARHCGVKLGFWGWRGAKSVGYPADLDYLDLLFTGVRLQMSAKVNPQVKNGDDLGEAVASFKAAGWKWYDIHAKLADAGFWEYKPKYQYDAQKDGGPMIRAYKRWLKDHPDQEHIGENPKSYKLGFVKGFSDEVRQRIYRMSQNRKQEVEEKGYGIVLANRTDELEKFLFEQFPELAPHDPNCQCRRCKPPKGRRVAVKEQRVSAAAYNRGRDEGSKVDLSGGRNNVGGGSREIAPGS